MASNYDAAITVRLSQAARGFLSRLAQSINRGNNNVVYDWIKREAINRPERKDDACRGFATTRRDVEVAPSGCEENLNLVILKNIN